MMAMGQREDHMKLTGDGLHFSKVSHSSMGINLLQEAKTTLRTFYKNGDDLPTCHFMSTWPNVNMSETWQNVNM